MMPLSVRIRIGGHTIGSASAATRGLGSDRLVRRDAARDDEARDRRAAAAAASAAVAAGVALGGPPQRARRALGEVGDGDALEGGGDVRAASVALVVGGPASQRAAGVRAAGTADLRPAYEKSHEARSAASRVFDIGIGSACARVALAR